ncbi:MAG: hypothetical protein A2Z76_00465 [Chloroflexi bacterium RBG_13_56_8b]|nr:MAG: hypothetical protein A2Z76_00465 [Chloroflexi bacterium RBG_13_56_8b]
MTTSPGSNGSKVGKWWSSLEKWVPYIVAFVILVIFGFFAYFMLGKTGAEETEWTRSVYVFSGIEAIAFAAAGFLFGKEVHRAQAEKADDRAAQAQQQATTYEKDAISGKVLANAIKFKAEAYQGKAPEAFVADRGRGLESPPSGTKSVEAGFAELDALAKDLFS